MKKILLSIGILLVAQTALAFNPFDEIVMQRNSANTATLGLILPIPAGAASAVNCVDGSTSVSTLCVFGSEFSLLSGSPYKTMHIILPESQVTNLTSDLANLQPLNSKLTEYAATTIPNGNLLMRDNSGLLGSTSITSLGQSLMAAANTTAMKSIIFTGLSSDIVLADGTSATANPTLVNLSNVDNTSDLNKPVSTATATALAGKFANPTGSTAQYIKGSGSLGTLDTSAVPENGNLYLTNARVIAATLSGFSSTTGMVSSSDSLLLAIEKIVGNINAMVTGVSSFNTRAGAVTLSSLDVTNALGFTPESALTKGNLTESTSNILTITGGTNSVIGAGASILVKQSSTTVDGYLNHSDYNTFNGKQAALAGTGFVKSAAGVISYDTSTYLTSISGIAAGGVLNGTFPNPSLANSGVSAGTYTFGSNGSITVNAGGQITNAVSGINRTFNYPSRALNSCFQISTTQDAEFHYKVDVTTGLSLTSGAQGTVTATSYTNSGCTTGAQGIADGTAAQTGSLVVGLNISQINSISLDGTLPAGKWVKITTANTVGTPTFSIRAVQAETLLN